MKNKSGPFLGLSVLALNSLVGCGSDSSGPVTMTEAIGLVESGVETTGTSLEGANLMTARRNMRTHLSALTVTPFTSSMCTVHGDPSDGAGGYMSQSNELYPYAATYCGLTVNSGDTVIGGFSLAKSLICSLEKGGIEFNGAVQSINVAFTDTECWPTGGPDGAGTSVTISATGTSPASFNTYFDKGVVFTVTEFGLTFSIAANLDSDKIEFIAQESWTNGNNGVMSGAIDRSSGRLQFEKRDERVRAGCSDSSCGWNKHTRILANLTMVDGEPSNLESFEFANASVDVNSDALTNGNHSGRLVTAKGSLDGQIKARLFSHNISGGNASGLTTVGNYAETANTACASGAGVDTSAGCSSETGIAKFTNDTKFMLYTGQITPDTWLANFGGFNFTTVDLDADQAYE